MKSARIYDAVKAAERKDMKCPALEDLEKLKKKNVEMSVRWRVDRHDLKVREVSPPTTTQLKYEDCIDLKEQGKAKTYGVVGGLWAYYASCSGYIRSSISPAYTV